MVRIIIAIIFSLTSVVVFAEPVLNSATLPNARVVPLAGTATIFMTTINTGDMDATNCTVIPSAEIGFQDITNMDTNWALTDAAGMVVGNQNDPFGIVAGGSAQLVLGISRSAAAGGFDTIFNPIFHVECDGGFGSTGWPAVNGARIRFSDMAPDIIPIIQTLTADGIANFDPDNRLAGVSVAAINNTAIINGTGEEEIGVGGAFMGFRDAGQFGFFACETDATGACTSEMSTCSPNRFNPCFTTMIGATPKTFSFFPILPTGLGAPFLPELYRFSTSFHDSFGTNNAMTSVALDSSAPTHSLNRPAGGYEFVARNKNDLGARTLRTGHLAIGDLDAFGVFFRTIDRGAFISVVQQFFLAEGGFSVVGEETCSQSEPCQSELQGNLTCTFYDTGAGTSSDGAINDCNCTIQSKEGGTCSIPDAQGEQIDGEPDLFDVLELASLRLGRDESFRVSTDDFNTKNWLSVSSNGGTFDQAVVTNSDGQEEFTLENCTISLNSVDLANSSKVYGAFFNISNCADDSRLKALEGTAKKAFIVVTRQFDGSCIYQFFIPFDRNDPDTATFSFFVKTDIPPVLRPIAPNSHRQFKSKRQQIAQQLANSHSKPVYWYINGKDILAASPDRH